MLEPVTDPTPGTQAWDSPARGGGLTKAEVTSDQHHLGRGRPLAIAEVFGGAIGRPTRIRPRWHPMKVTHHLFIAEGPVD